MGKKLVTKLTWSVLAWSLHLNWGDKKVKKKINFEFCCKIYDKSVKGDTMNQNSILRQKLDRKAVWRKQEVRGKMTAFSSVPSGINYRELPLSRHPLLKVVPLHIKDQDRSMKAQSPGSMQDNSDGWI